MGKTIITIQRNYVQPYRKTVNLDEYVFKKLRMLQSDLIKAGKRHVSFSKVLELVLREFLRR